MPRDDVMDPQLYGWVPLRPPIESLNEIIKDIILRKQRETWLNRSDCKIARTLWPRIDGNRKKPLLGYKKKLVCIAIGVVTGNYPIGVNLKKCRIVKDYYCRKCNEEEETLEYLLCKRPALRSRRFAETEQDFMEGWKCFNA